MPIKPSEFEYMPVNLMLCLLDGLPCGLEILNAVLLVLENFPHPWERQSSQQSKCPCRMGRDHMKTKWFCYLG